MSYYWQVTINGVPIKTKAQKGHTAIGRCMRRMENPLKGRIDFQRIGKVERTTCELCGKRYDTDDKSYHENSYWHKEHVQPKGEQ